jgi:ubiquitin C-terminal hydrolase
LDVEGRECSKCGKTSEASMRTRIKLLPRVLIMHLKRFANNGTKLKNPLEFDEVLRIDKEALSINSGRYGTHRKLMRSNTMVQYDQKIDISDVDREREEGHSYHLYALIIHQGYSTNQGHYFAFVKN